MRTGMARTALRATLGAALGCAALTVAGDSLAAQAPEEDDIAVGGRGFFQAGYVRLDLDGLNRDLQAAGYPALERDHLTLGGAGYGSHGRFLIGGEGHALLGEDETTADGSRQLSPSGGYGLFRVGYLAVSSHGLDVYPLFGIGGGGMSLKIAERSAPTFDDVLADPERSAKLSTGMFLLDVGLAVNYRIVVRGDDEFGGFLIGLQAGYTFAPGNTSWSLDDINTVAGGPNFQIEGPYLRVSLGGWGRERPEEAEER